MATFIKNMFRPKWQSNNPEVRKNALLGLDCQSDKSLEILKTTLETDDVHEIKVAALGKIDDMDYLIGFALEQSPAQFPELKNKLTDLFQKSYERDPSLSVL
ncbi:MAG: hypothetical protein MI864_01145, partial [Pseudomonadales bacterium]|nr:hypothetical protein [Pseudomonadales bacterium]